MDIWNCVLVIAISTAFEKSESTTLKDEQPCQLRSAERGTCKRFPLCKSAADSLKMGVKPDLCGFEGRVPIVCCKDEKRSDDKTTPLPRPEALISQIKCREYAQAIRVTVAAIPLLVDPKPVEIEVSNPACHRHNRKALIVGGENATVGEFPHMAAIGHEDKKTGEIDWFCGGSLISDRFILTAAHCLKTARGSPTVVRLGELDMNNSDDGAHPVDYQVEETIRHPEYKPPAHYNDIALLRLSKKVEFTPHIRPACLYHKSTFHTNIAMAAGWGRIGYARETSDMLLKVTLNIIDNEHCNHVYKSDANSEALRDGIRDSQMCAGDLLGQRDTCQGDSGGPLEVKSKINHCLHYLVGVTSFGKLCGLPNTSGVYTRVSSYVTWIEDHVWLQD